MSRRARSAPKVNISASVRLGLESLCEGNETTITSMLSLGDDKAVIDGLIDCMGVSSISAEMLLANYFSAGMLGAYCKQRLGKSDKGGAATLAERIAREWAKPSFNPLLAPAGTNKRKETEEPAEDAAAKRASAMADLMAKRSAKAAKVAKTPASPPPAAANASAASDPPVHDGEREEAAGDEDDGGNDSTSLDKWSLPSCAGNGVPAGGLDKWALPPAAGNGPRVGASCVVPR